MIVSKSLLESYDKMSKEINELKRMNEDSERKIKNYRNDLDDYKKILEKSKSENVTKEEVKLVSKALDKEIEKTEQVITGKLNIFDQASLETYIEALKQEIDKIDPKMKKIESIKTIIQDSKNSEIVIGYIKLLVSIENLISKALVILKKCLTTKIPGQGEHKKMINDIRCKYDIFECMYRLSDFIEVFCSYRSPSKDDYSRFNPYNDKFIRSITNVNIKYDLNTYSDNDDPKDINKRNKYVLNKLNEILTEQKDKSNYEILQFIFDIDATKEFINIVNKL